MFIRSKLSASLALALVSGGAAHAVPVNFLDNANRLIRVDSATPGTVSSTTALTGLQAGETLLGFDYRPASPRVLYGLGSTGRVYAINPLTGGATALGAPVVITGTAAGVDFNPSVDRIRVVTSAGQDLRLNPDNGALAATDAPLAYAAGDAGFGTAPRVTAAAYTNNLPGATPTTLYVIDTGRGVLATQGSVNSAPVSPNSGQLFTVGATGVTSTDAAGFDIGRDGTVLASFTSPATGTTSLYSLNLATGAATLIGTVGTAGQTYTGLAIALPSVASFGTTANQTAVGGALDNFVGVPGAGLGALFASIDGLAPGARADALSQLTPAAYSLLPEVTLRTVEFQQDTLQRYLRDFRDGGTGNRVGGDAKIGSFLVASGREGRYDAATDRSRVEYGAAGVIGGVDLRLRENLLVGITGGYDDARVRLGSTRNSKIENWFVGGYATARLGPGFIDLFGSYGEADYDLRRTVQFGGGTTALDFASTTESRTYFGGGTVGINIKAGGFVLEPFAGARYARVKIDGFSDGTGIGALTLGRTTYESVLGNFGAKVGGEFTVGNATVRPEVRGAYRYEFKDDREAAFSFGFAGTGNNGALAFTPTPLRRSYYTAGAGFTVSGATSPLSLVVDYTGEFAKDRNINGITGGLRLVF
ncbi:DUF4394 domain-containing protein [Glacieibacterium frigidum]|uniref:DUF4394 domain-containing protein n=1 Tax=Glacieibacterium frigidum TaxID=2593303 RepID=A0A552UGB8_9SPHN|nr:DUF4394 domain-containing protein [Glacieibacterium frigidum]TRW17237.1 DUF4394 domain-containing protein [Glacieibacterium frigidum]